MGGWMAARLVAADSDAAIPGVAHAPSPPPSAFLLPPIRPPIQKPIMGHGPPGPFIPPNNASNWGMQKGNMPIGKGNILFCQIDCPKFLHSSAPGSFNTPPPFLFAFTPPLPPPFIHSIFPFSSQFPHFSWQNPLPLPFPPSEEIVIERKGASVGSGPPGSIIGPGGTPSKRGSGKKGPNGAQSAAHSLASPSPPPPPIQSSQPSLADRGEGEDHQKDYRVAMFGGGGVGKSALVQRFIKNTFSDAYLPTIEDTYQQVITCSEQGRMAVCTLHIIDTTGSHQFPAMQRLAIQRGHAFILVYSITSRQSLEELGPIVRTLREVKGEGAMGDVPIVLVGNKMDEQGRREVNRETGEALAQRWGCEFVETSAKQGRNVTELFQRLLSLEKRRHLRLAVQDSDGGEKEGGAGGMQELNCAKQRKCAII